MIANARTLTEHKKRTVVLQCVEKRQKQKDSLYLLRTEQVGGIPEVARHGGSLNAPAVMCKYWSNEEVERPELS